MTVSPEDIAVALEKVDAIDLAPINMKLRHEEPGFWSDERIAGTERDYRRFLALNLVRPGALFSVDKALDEYWHQHILDTRKYAADCETVLGYFLHHYPYFGLTDAQEHQANVELFAETQDLWEQAFGEPMGAAAPEVTLDKPLGGYSGYDDDPDLMPKRIYAYPQGCKNGQHCSKIVTPERLDPNPVTLPQEPFTPIRRGGGGR